MQMVPTSGMFRLTKEWGLGQSLNPPSSHPQLPEQMMPDMEDADDDGRWTVPAPDGRCRCQMKTDDK